MSYGTHSCHNTLRKAVETIANPHSTDVHLGRKGVLGRVFCFLFLMDVMASFCEAWLGQLRFHEAARLGAGGVCVLKARSFVYFFKYFWET